LQKKIQQVENELDQVQENLAGANTKLEEKDKALQNVRTSLLLIVKHELALVVIDWTFQFDLIAELKCNRKAAELFDLTDSV
jgi:flagellar motility protein MotE (MotC chaperone)